MSSYLDRALARAETLGSEDDPRLDHLPPWLETVVRVSSAQGVIDNGGLRYFFGADWPGQPNYGEFVWAYQKIGCTVGAEEIDAAVKSFGFEHPERDVERRLAHMEKIRDPRSGGLRGWGDRLCGLTEVWELLEAYCKKHMDPEP